MTLLQKIRAEQVLKEEGLNLPIKVIHKEDVKTIIGDRQFTLIFPKFLFNYDCSKKTINFLFMGKHSIQREKFLTSFDNSLILYSDNGRDNKIKARDEEYFNYMSKTKFVLCPNGAFKWTYRFFEAIIFKAIPIIEEDCKLYDGYKFYKQNDKYQYRADWVEHNLNKLKREMTWT